MARTQNSKNTRGIHRDRGLHPMLAQVPEQQQEQQQITLGKVEIGLMRHNREECDAALDWHFAGKSPPTWQSHISELDLDYRIVNALELNGIETAAELKKAVFDGRIVKLPNLGVRAAQQCARAVAAIGRLVPDWVI